MWWNAWHRVYLLDCIEKSLKKKDILLWVLSMVAKMPSIAETYNLILLCYVVFFFKINITKSVVETNFSFTFKSENWENRFYLYRKLKAKSSAVFKNIFLQSWMFLKYSKCIIFTNGFLFLFCNTNFWLFLYSDISEVMYINLSSIISFW